MVAAADQDLGELVLARVPAADPAAPYLERSDRSAGVASARADSAAVFHQNIVSSPVAPSFETLRLHDCDPKFLR